MADETPADDAEQNLAALLDQIATPKELRELLDAPGVDDELINRFVLDIGVEAVLDRVFGLMGARFLPGKAGRDSGVVQWNVDGPDGRRVYHLVIKDSTAKGSRGAADARTTLTMSTPNLLRLCAGRLNAMTAVLTGKIKISGDIVFGARLQGWFDH